MKVVFHPGLRSDIEAILDWVSTERPATVEPLVRHLQEAIARVSVWPAVAPTVPKLGVDIRALTLTHYPYRVFYRVRPDVIQILHIRHTSRVPWEGGR